MFNASTNIVEKVIVMCSVLCCCTVFQHPEHGDFGAYRMVDAWAHGCELGHIGP
uniref:Uncharacterized protein n=1 Tax=Aegilops tauschii subsp. strangulata TaxID=200361 RepID=A0A453APJ4_AEGTS